MRCISRFAPYLLTCFFYGFCLPAAAPGQGGTVSVFFKGALVSLDDQGGAFVAYRTYNFDQVSPLTVMKLRSDGTPDPAFGTAGAAKPALNFDEHFHNLQRHGSGLLLAGEREAFRNPAIARLDASGALDASFAQDGVFAVESLFKSDIDNNSWVGVGVHTLTALPDGKILATATLRQFKGRLDKHVSYLFRLTADGRLDETFADHGKIRAIDDKMDGEAVASVDPEKGAIYLFGWGIDYHSETDVRTAMIARRFRLADGAEDRDYGSAQPQPLRNGTSKDAGSGLRSVFATADGFAALVDFDPPTGLGLVRFDHAGKVIRTTSADGLSLIVRDVEKAHYNAAGVADRIGSYFYLPVEFMIPQKATKDDQSISVYTTTSGLARFDQSFNLDATYGRGGIRLDEAVEGDVGQIVCSESLQRCVHAYSDTYEENGQTKLRHVVERLDASGAIDSTFGTQGKVTIPGGTWSSGV